MTPQIVHVASGREWRGGQRQVWLLARQLDRLGVDQVVVTGAETELARRLEGSGVRVRRAAWRAGLDPRVVWSILGVLRARPAILHAHDGHALTLAGLCAVLTNAPLVATRRVVFPLRRTWLWRRAARVIAISPAVRNALLADGLAPERVLVISDGLDLEQLRESAGRDLYRRLGVPENGQVAVNLGALTPEKDHLSLLQAAALLVQDLPNLHWVLVGDGPLHQQLSREVERLQLRQRVHFVPHLADPHQALGGAEVFVLSSTSEGFGSSALAAMAVGVPVVGTRVGGLADLLGSGAGALVPPADPPALAGAVRRVLTDQEHRKTLIARARQEIDRFSAEAMAERVLSVYRSLRSFS
jgi:glycosyltransferase involved in cell wall biosynthesis